MPSRLELETARLRDRLERGDPYWPAQVAVATASALNFVLAERVTVGPTWLLPSVEGVLLLALVVIAPARATSHSRRTRRLALAVIGFVSLANIVSLGLLVHFLINGGQAGGHKLILSGVVSGRRTCCSSPCGTGRWIAAGPSLASSTRTRCGTSSFPQMENPQLAPADWRPGFVDYLYTSLTNATAFSPTDTMPLTQSAKVVMALQSISALLTVGLVVARAVNILG